MFLKNLNLTPHIAFIIVYRMVIYWFLGFWISEKKKLMTSKNQQKPRKFNVNLLMAMFGRSIFCLFRCVWQD